MSPRYAPKLAKTNRYKPRMSEGLVALGCCEHQEIKKSPTPSFSRTTPAQPDACQTSQDSHKFSSSPRTLTALGDVHLDVANAVADGFHAQTKPAVLEHIDGDVIVVYARGARVDAGV